MAALHLVQAPRPALDASQIKVDILTLAVLPHVRARCVQSPEPRYAATSMATGTCSTRLSFMLCHGHTDMTKLQGGHP